MKFEEENDIRICPICGEEFKREDMCFTKDRQGFSCRLVCFDCHAQLTDNGYDDEYYDVLD